MMGKIRYDADGNPYMAEPFSPHSAFEWKNPEGSFFTDRWNVYEIVEGLTIAFDLYDNEYFLLDGSLYQDGDWDRGEDVTEETIDNMINRLQEFKRIVFHIAPEADKDRGE